MAPPRRMGKEPAPETRLNLRVKRARRTEFKAVVLLEGLIDTSTALNLYIEQKIKNARRRDPKAFAKALAIVEAQEAAAERAKVIPVVEVEELPPDYTEKGLLVAPNVARDS